MKVIIVRPDNFVSIDGYGLHIDLSDYLPENFWALHWSGSHGEIEYTDKKNESIKSISDYQEIIDKYNRIKAENENKKNSPLNCNQLCNLIDFTAGNARKRLVSEGYAIEEEYWIAYKEANAYLDAIKEDSENVVVPLSVQTHADIEGISGKAAAEIICQMHDAWFALIDKIRDIRLRGKAAVKQAAIETPDADLMTIAQQFIDQLKELKET